MTNEDYQLEELENAAVNKSGNAKRIAAAAGLFTTGGAAGYAATQFSTGGEDEPALEPLDDNSGENAGANQVQEPKPQPQPVTHQPEPKATTPDDGPDVSFDKTTHYYDEDHNLVASAEEGTIDGKDFGLYDIDGDMKADVLVYDENGNGVYDENEYALLEGRNQISMGHEATQHEDIFLASRAPEPEPLPEPDPDIIYYEDKGYVDNDVHNDFEDEKTGEDYSHDYADNNDDYNNGEHSASSENESNYAYDDAKDDTDYVSNDFAANDTADSTFDDLGPDSLDIV